MAFLTRDTGTIAFRRTTDASGDPVAAVDEAGAAAGGTRTLWGESAAAGTLARTGTGTYTFTLSADTLRRVGQRIAYVDVQPINSVAGLIARVTGIVDSTGVISFTTFVSNTGTATSVISGQIAIEVVISPMN